MKIMQKKLSRRAFRKWLSSAVGVVLTSVVFVQDINAIKINVNDPRLLSQMMNNSQLVFPKGQYLVNYTISNKKADDFLPIRKTIWAVSVEAISPIGRKVGDIEQLLKILESYQYCITDQESEPSIRLWGVLIEQPDSPVELAALLAELKKVSIFRTREDGSGEIHMGNSSIGSIPLAKKQDM
ncbi:hypothetical protein [Shewanella frigidimarina]|uniref:hypothetical protein n=1 Tax=Shewanella frigidimarina TaxID=56812 RepID=UPI003D7B1E6A